MGRSRSSLFAEGSKNTLDWGEEGPPRIWSRPLGGGFSSIVGDGERLYATYRDGADELVVALEPGTGQTKGESNATRRVPPFLKRR